MKENIVMTKKELQKFLQERMNWFVEYANPFQEATMVSYISNGLKKLHDMNTTKDELIVMYDEDNELMFKKN